MANEIIYRATGNTYPARTYLAAVGLKWDAAAKEWRGPSFDADRWSDLCRISYDRKAAKACQAVTIEQVTA